MKQTEKGKVYQYKCTICTSTFKYMSFLSKHMERVHLPPKYKCEICSRLFKREDTKFYHIRAVHLKEKPHSCPIEGCNAQFAADFPLQKHIKSIHCSEEDKRKFPCPNCPKKFTRKYAQRNHFNNVHLGQGHKCPIEHCDFSANDRASVKNHLRSHTQEKLFPCGTCPLKFKCASDLKKHEKAVHDPNSRKYSCEKCPKTFKRPEHLKEHTKIHEVENREQFNCSQCPKIFLSGRSLNFHFELNHQNKSERQNCPFPNCEKVFPCPKYLQIHIGLIHKPTFAECYFCKKTFRTRQRRDIHMKRKHLLERAFNCTFKGCGKSFVTTVELKRHEKNSHKRRRNCKKCQITFPSRKALNFHIENFHKMAMKHKCTFCRKMFVRNIHLDNHIRSVHTKENPYKCNFCNFEGASVAYLNSHLKNVHQ